MLFTKINEFKPKNISTSKNYSTTDETLKKDQYFQAKKKRTAMLRHQSALKEYFFFPSKVTKTEDELFSPLVKNELKLLIAQDLLLSGSGPSILLFSEINVSKTEQQEEEPTYFNLFICTPTSILYNIDEVDVKIENQLKIYSRQMENLFSLEGSG